MKHTWLARGIVDGFDDSHARKLLGDAAVEFTLEEAKRIAEQTQHELEQSEPDTHALERDRHNEPVRAAQGNRRERRRARALSRRRRSR